MAGASGIDYRAAEAEPTLADKNSSKLFRTFPEAPRVGELYTPLPDKKEDGKITAHAVQTILVEPQALYDLWSDVSSIPLWQEHVISVTPVSETVSHWVIGELDNELRDNPDHKEGKKIEFDSEITEAVPGKRLAWRSITPEVEQSGVVTFVPHEAGRGTVVTLIQTAKVPGGLLGNAAAAVGKRGPKQTVIEDLRHFKQLAEAGEIPTVEGQPHGPRGASGGIKAWIYGENNPTPPGTSGAA